MSETTANDIELPGWRNRGAGAKTAHQGQKGGTGTGRPSRAAFVEVARSLFRRAVRSLPFYAEEPQWDAFTRLRIWDHNEFPDTGPQQRHGLSPHP